jgi:hypothetical protein
MPTYTYATPDDCLAYTEGLVIDDADAFDRLLARCERDIDNLLGNWVPLAGGLKLDPTQLLDWEAAALNRAVCAQLEWRIQADVETGLRGEQASPVVKSVKGPDFEKTFAITDAMLSARPNRYGPKVRDELAPIRHLRMLSGRATA